VWARLQANRADTGILNRCHVFTQHFFCFALLPEKRQDIVFTLVVKNFYDTF